MNSNPQHAGKIVKLQAENVKRLSAVEIEPNGNLVVIAGDNGNGKSSVLDSIQYALGGAEMFAKEPVRQGADKARIVVDLGDLIVTRTISRNGNTSLKVTNSAGLTYSSPQAILDKLVGKLSFDPLSFAQMKPVQQSETLRVLAGLDFTKQKQNRQEKFDERTVVNRTVDALKNRIAALPAPKAGIPDVETSAAEIISKQQEAIRKNEENKAARDAVTELQREVMFSDNQLKTAEDERQNILDEICQLQKRLEEINTKIQTIVTNRNNQYQIHAKAKEEAEKLQDIDLQPFTDQLTSIEETNKLVRNKQQRVEMEKQFREEKDKADKLTNSINAIDAEIESAVQNAKYPIKGLSINADGDVLFNGLPLEQASSAEQLRVSVAIGLALNPKLKVLLVRDGSLLDVKSWKLLKDLATEADAQVWIEKVGTSGEVSVVIEDGMVKA